MITIDGISYPYRRLHRVTVIAGTLLHKPRSYFKHFTFIMKGTKIISIGWNNTYLENVRIGKTKIKYPLGGLHAEADAIRKLRDFDVCRRSTLVNIRINNRGHLRNSKPCKNCLELISAFGFSRVYYSTNMGFERISI